MHHVIVCGLLERDGKALFMIKKEGGEERLFLPHIYASTKGDVASQLAEAFRKQTDIRAEVGPIVGEGEHGDIRYVVFRMESDKGEPKPCGGYEGFSWVGLEDVKKMKLAKSMQWARERTK